MHYSDYNVIFLCPLSYVYALKYNLTLFGNFLYIKKNALTLILS